MEANVQLKKYQREYAAIGWAPHLSLPVIVGLLVASIVAVSLTTYILQKTTSDEIIDHVTLSYIEELFTTQRKTISGFFSDVEVLLEAPRIAVALAYSVTNETLRRVSYHMARTEVIRLYYMEVHAVDYAFWNMTGTYRAHSYGFYDNGIEWDGFQPGIMSDYAIDNTTATLPRVMPPLRTYYFSDLEPVVFLAREIEGIGFQKTFVYEAEVEAPNVYTGVFHSVWENGRLAYYVNLQFSVLNIDDFLAGLTSDFPFQIALLELETGEIIGDSNQHDTPFSISGSKVSRRTYAESSNALLRDGGSYIYTKINSRKQQREDILFTRSRTTIGGVDCYIGFGSMPVRNLRWLMYVVVPVAGVRGAIDELNTKITASIACTYAVVVLVNVAVLVWISKLLGKLTRDMELVAEMRLDDLDDSSASRLPITELKRIQLSFFIMVEMMKEYRNYLPQALLEAGDDDLPEAEEPEPTSLLIGGGRVGFNLPDVESPSEVVPEVAAKESAKEDGVEIAPSGSSKNLRISTQEDGVALAKQPSIANLKKSASNQEIKEYPTPARSSPNGSVQGSASARTQRFQTGLQHRRLSLLHLSLPHTHALAQSNPSHAHELGELILPAVIESIERNEGVVMSVGIDVVVVCWNGHKTTHNHERKAVQCAVDIAKEFRQKAKINPIFSDTVWIACVASGQGVIGVTGTGRHRAPVVLGQVANLVGLMEHLHVHFPSTVLITDKVYDATMTHFTSRVVDIISPSENKKTNVYEVMVVGTDGRDAQPGDLRSYVEGFSALSNRQYKAASEYFLDHMRSPDGHGLEPHAGRLYKMSQAQVSIGRRFVGWNESEVAPFDPSTDLPADVAEKYKAKSRRNSYHGQQSSHMEEKGPIKKVQESDDVVLRKAIESHRTTAAVPGRGDVASMMEFADAGGRVWKRSNKLLGAGAFGEVYLGMGSGGDLVALKTIKLKVKEIENPDVPPAPRNRRAPKADSAAETAVEEVLREVSLLSELRDENIVGYISSCVVNGMLVIVIEYIPGGSLASLLTEFGVLGLAATQRYVRDIVRGLAFLHKNDVMHRDVKPHNVLLMIDGQCKLTDFGASAKLGSLAGEKNKITGTPLYMAPEQCMGEVCYASDVWGVGILTYQLLTGRIPYSEEILGKFNPYTFMYRLGREDTFVPTLGDALTFPIARGFCESVLLRDPTRRPTAEHLLSHPFLL